MDPSPKTFQEQLNQAGVSRRTFLKFCGVMVGALALPLNYISVMAEALASATRLPVVWLEFQDCTGDSESFLRAGRTPNPLSAGTTEPNVIDLLLDFLSLDYHETLMAASGDSARKSLDDTLAAYNGQYVCVVEGAIPTAQNGAFCTIGGRTAVSILQEVSSKAMATIALGACATDGGVAAAAPNPTGAVGVQTAAPDAPNLINLPGCPANVVNVVACLVHFLTFKQWPDLDGPTRKPLFAYGDTIHHNCERRYYHDKGMFAKSWGDDGHRAGWCLRMLGCKGPSTKSNCWSVKWNESTSWPIGAGHGCIGCTTSGFWDKSPVYQEG